MPHDIVGGHVGHNHAADHLHSHMPAADLAAELQVLTAQFIDGFRAARDKAAYLAIAGVPLEISGDGGPALKFVDVQLTTEWQVGTAAPSFGSRELSYMPYPGEMISERPNLGFVYVSLEEKRVVDLRDLLQPRLAAGHGHGHGHGPERGPGQGQGGAHRPAHRDGQGGGQGDGHGEGHRKGLGHGPRGGHGHNHRHSHGHGDGSDRYPAGDGHRRGEGEGHRPRHGRTHGHRHG